MLTEQYHFTKEAAMDQIINEIIEKLKLLFYDTPTIALAGAHAKGVADSGSDIDIFIFGNEPTPYEYRKEIIENFCDDPTQAYISETYDRPFGGNIDFIYKGIPIEVVARCKGSMEEKVDRAIRGEFEIIPQTWTSNGYYSFIYLSEVSFLKPILDEDGWLQSLKDRLSVYPPALKANIISTFMRRAHTWIGNFHYETALPRTDVLFIAPIVVNTLMNMVQVIFAINEIYFTGDKKLERALHEMPYCPALLLENLDSLLSFPHDEVHLKRQAELLKRIYSDLQQHIE